jgi:hypothetical protein
VSFGETNEAPEQSVLGAEPEAQAAVKIYMACQVVAQHDELPGQGWAICPSIVTSTLA